MFQMINNQQVERQAQPDQQLRNIELKQQNNTQTSSADQYSPKVPNHSNYKFHEAIFNKLSASTIMADKMIRLLSGCIKFIKVYNLTHNLKLIDRCAGQLGNYRRFLRFDRLLFILRDTISLFNKNSFSLFDYFQLFFKGILLLQDSKDLKLFGAQLNLVKIKQQHAQLRQQVGDLYFIECCFWLITLIHSYYYSKNIQQRSKLRYKIVRYLIDIITTYNDFSKRIFQLPQKLTCFLGLISCIINISIEWK